MNCGEIKRLLSEYVDETLDTKTKELVEKHLSTCQDCQQEVASLRMLISDLGSMESVAPPKDFLDQLHERMRQRLWLSKALRVLVLPLQVKLPMKLAGAAVMAVLVFAIFQVQKGEYGPKIEPLSHEEQVAEKEDINDLKDVSQEEIRKPQIARISVKAEPSHETMEAALIQEAKKAKAMPPVTDHEERMVKKEEPKSHLGNGVEQVVYRKPATERPSGKGRPIEWVLVTKRIPSPELYEATTEMETAPTEEGKMRGTLAMRETAAKAPLERDKRDDDILPKLKEILERLGGKVVSIEFEERANIPKSVQVEISAEGLDTFQNHLKELGDLESAAISLAGQDQETLSVRIRLFTSQ
jgi:hypothetical protein